MAATPTPLQMAEHVDLSLDTLRYCEPTALLPAHRTSRVVRIAGLRHSLDRLDGRLAYCGVATGEPTP